jgi:peptidyl-prolyl cis-trans isomerase D
MLSQVRGALKGAVAWIVVILLIAAFAMWGVPEMSSLAGGSAIKVGGQSYSQSYVQGEFNRIYQRRAQESGGALTREEAIASGLPGQVVEGITTQAAIEQFAERMNLALPRAAVRDYLTANEMFQNPATGRFDQVALQTILQNNNLSANAFEKIIKDDLTRSQLIDSLTTGSPAADAFFEPLLLRETERRLIAYLTVTDDMAGTAAEPTPDDLQQYYAANETAFTAPEYRTFDFLALRSEDFREGLEAPEEEMRRLYEGGRARLYDKPEQRTIYQLTYENEADALAAAASLRQGEPFESLAVARGMTLNAATLTEAQKSDILDPAVADAAFAEGLEEGAIVDPVRSLFGWTVAQIVNVTPAESRSYEEVRPELESAFLENDVRMRLQNAVDEIEEVRDTGAELAEAAEEAGFPVETVGPIDRLSFAPGGAIIDKVPGEAIAEAFALDEGEQSEAMRLSGEDGYFFVSLREIVPPALKPFDEVRDEVEQRWRAEERRARIAAVVQAIRDEVAAGKTLEDVAGQYTRAPIELLIDRRFQNEIVSRSFNEQIFFAGLDEIVAAPVGASGAQVLAEVREIGFGRNAIPPAEEEQIASLVGYQLDQELLEAFVTSIRDDYGVKINSAQIDALFADGL